MGELITVYKVDSAGTAPVPVKCREFKTLAADENGDIIYRNSHFATEAEAWDYLLSDHDAGVKLAGREVIRLRAQLAKAEKTLADEAVLWTETKENFRRWQLDKTVRAEPSQ